VNRSSKSRPDELEPHLRQCEAEAQERFSEAIEDLTKVKLEDWFTRLLYKQTIKNKVSHRDSSYPKKYTGVFV
jgi:hypothetical protein